MITNGVSLFPYPLSIAVDGAVHDLNENKDDLEDDGGPPPLEDQDVSTVLEPSYPGQYLAAQARAKQTTRRSEYQRNKALNRQRDPPCVVADEPGMQSVDLIHSISDNFRPSEWCIYCRRASKPHNTSGRCRERVIAAYVQQRRGERLLLDCTLNPPPPVVSLLATPIVVCFFTLYNVAYSSQ